VPLPDILLPQIAQPLLPIIVAILLYARKDADSPDAMTQEPAFDVVTTQGKGLGAIASRDFARGEILCSEMPLLVWPTKLETTEAKGLVAQLAPKAKEAFFSLANNQSSSSKLDEVVSGEGGEIAQLSEI
jgi:hypothetical protein